MIIPLLKGKSNIPTYEGIDGKKHYKPWSERNKANSARKQEAQSVYNTPMWKEMRKAVTLRDNGLCQRCLKEFDKVTPSTQVHHIIPILSRDGDERLKIAFDYNNVVCLCDKCHYIVHKYPKDNRRWINK